MILKSYLQPSSAESQDDGTKTESAVVECFGLRSAGRRLSAFSALLVPLQTPCSSSSETSSSRELYAVTCGSSATPTDDLLLAHLLFMVPISAGQSTNAGGIGIGMGTLESWQGVGRFMDGGRIVTMVRVWTLLQRGDIDESFWLESGSGNEQGRCLASSWYRNPMSHLRPPLPPLLLPPLLCANNRTRTRPIRATLQRTSFSNPDRDCKLSYFEVHACTHLLRAEALCSIHPISSKRHLS